jgi:hypothetical protein
MHQRCRWRVHQYGGARPSRGHRGGGRKHSAVANGKIRGDAQAGSKFALVRIEAVVIAHSTDRRRGHARWVGSQIKNGRPLAQPRGRVLEVELGDVVPISEPCVKQRSMIGNANNSATRRESSQQSGDSESAVRASGVDRRAAPGGQYEANNNCRQRAKRATRTHGWLACPSAAYGARNAARGTKRPAGSEPGNNTPKTSNKQQQKQQ